MTALPQIEMENFVFIFCFCGNFFLNEREMNGIRALIHERERKTQYCEHETDCVALN